MLEYFFIRLKGSSGSGNWRHRGNPPNRGGSSAGGGLVKLGLDSNSSVEDRRRRAYADKTKGDYPSGRIELLDSVYREFSQDCIDSGDPGCLALNLYTSMAYLNINSALRADDLDDGDAEIIKNIDKAMDRAPRTESNMTVYRNVSLDVFRNFVNEGAVFQDKAFVSTTIDGGRKLEIRVPKGSKGIWIKNISEYRGENEFLLPRGSKFRVLKKDIGSAILELIPE